jgi:hypothetical protein
LYTIDLDFDTNSAAINAGDVSYTLSLNIISADVVEIVEEVAEIEEIIEVITQEIGVSI